MELNELYVSWLEEKTECPSDVPPGGAQKPQSQLYDVDWFICHEYGDDLNGMIYTDGPNKVKPILHDHPYRQKRPIMYEKQSLNMRVP